MSVAVEALEAAMRECYERSAIRPSFAIVPGRRYRVRVRRRGRTCLRQRLGVHPAFLRALRERTA